MLPDDGVLVTTAEETENYATKNAEQLLHKTFNQNDLKCIRLFGLWIVDTCIYMLCYDMYSANKSHGNYVPDLRKLDFNFKKNK